MGVLDQFNLKDLIENYGCRNFVETGTGIGISLHYAATFPFAILHTCECEPDLAKAVQSLFQDDPRIHIHTKTSEDMLQSILPSLPPDQSTIFWLDAHFPGADYTKRGYTDERNEDLRLPLERELQLISTHRPNANDVIIIDDLRIYEEGSFGSGPCPAEHCGLPPERRNVNFVSQFFDGTHNIKRFYENEGYLLLTPKQIGLSKSVTDTLQLAFQFQRENRQADCLRVLEQILWHHTGNDKVALFVALAVIKAATDNQAFAPLIAPTQKLLQQAKESGWDSLAIVSTRFHGVLALALAHKMGISVSALIEEHPEISKHSFSGIPVLTPEHAVKAGLRHFIMTTKHKDQNLQNLLQEAAQIENCKIETLKQA